MSIDRRQPSIQSHKDSFPATKNEYEKAYRSLSIARFAQKNRLQLSNISERDADIFAYRINQEFGENTATVEKIYDGDLLYRVVVPEIDYELHASILDTDTGEVIPFSDDVQRVAA